MRSTLASVVLITIFFSVPRVAQAVSNTSWSAGGWLSAAWSGGWPELDLRLRAGWLIYQGHEVGLTAGLSTHRLASQALYLSHYSHTWTGGRRWPVVSLWLGGATDITGFLGQSKLVLGMSLGLRVPLGRRVVLRFELGHEMRAGAYWADKTFLALSLEIVSGPGWWRQRRVSASETARGG